MSFPRRAFPLQPLLDERRRVEQLRALAWSECVDGRNRALERVRLLERAAAPAYAVRERERAGRCAALEWNRARAAIARPAALERLRDRTELRDAAFATLRAARVARRVIETLEERWQRARRRRRARAEAAALEEAAILARTRLE